MKKIITLLSFVFITAFLFAQNEVDAFRFSYINYLGTARSNAMANAFGALGADMSTASTNPAGIGIYKHSEFSFTPNFIMNSCTSNFAGESELAPTKLGLSFSNLGIVFSKTNSDKNIKYFNFSFGYNRTNNLKENTYISGINNKGSMLDYFMLNANGNTPDELDKYSTYGAWDTYLIDTLTGDPTKYTNALWWTQTGNNTPKYGERQTRIQQISGGAGEYFLNGAVNYKDMLYLGLTMGIQTFKYESHIQYTESDFVDNSDLNHFTYNEDQIDEGTGVNIKAGLIFKPVKFFRIGAAVHSPTYFTINDWYKTKIHSYWNSADSQGKSDYDYKSGDDYDRFKYNLLTPFRLMADAGFVLGKTALIDFGYEYLDYSTMQLSSSSYFFNDENKNIRDIFTATSNYRIGGEVRFGPMSLRAGYALFGNPFKDASINFSKSQISAGIGFRAENFYVDLAYSQFLRSYDQYMYNGYSDEPVPKLNFNDGNISITLGFAM
jgi:hypothetical protein